MIFPKLSDREREVALLLCDGLKNVEIGDELGISAKTVDTHRRHIIKKLAVKNNIELVRLAIREGWIQP